MLTSNRSSISSKEDLSDEFYGWHMEKGFQWYRDEDSAGVIYTIAFYEEHPYFNCLLLVENNEKNNYSFGETHQNAFSEYAKSNERACLPFTKVVEPWIERINKNYNRREKRKRGSNVKI